MSARSALHSRHPTNPVGIRKLAEAMKKVGLSADQQEHLAERVFFDEEAVTYWLNLHRKDPEQAKKYLVSMAPPAAPRPVSLMTRIARAVASLFA